ncbi:MAG: M23 family metallopeptidase [Deltaproteobacteria bacterium]|nr:M23 family metallopeptidase [Deltaproteobacteria bacterium]
MGIFKDYHIIIVPKDKDRTRSFKVSGFTLKILLFTLILSIPLFFVSVLSAIHYQNKLIAFKRSNYENRELYENKKDLVLKLSRLEKLYSVMDDSIAHLSELMDIDPQSLKFGMGPIDDIDFSWTSDTEEGFTIPNADEVIDDWLNENGELTVNKFKGKISDIKENTGMLNKKLEEIFAQNKDKINYVTATPSLLPTEGWITSEFGIRKHPIGRRFKMHEGIDVASPVGTPIKSPAGGRVLFASRRGGYGNTIIIQHGYGIATIYAHLHDMSVKQGETIKRGDTIGSVGNTGYTTGAHLHYEVRIDGMPSDPLAFIVQ